MNSFQAPKNGILEELIFNFTKGIKYITSKALLRILSQYLRTLPMEATYFDQSYVIANIHPSMCFYSVGSKEP